MFVCVGRPDPTPLLLKRQREVFRIAKREVDAAPRLLGAPEEVGDEKEEDNSEDAKLEEMDGNDDNSKDVNVHNEEEEETDDDVSRKDSFYDTKKDGDKVADSHLPPRLPPATAGLLLFIAVLVGLVVTWYTRKVQQRRSGLRKKLDMYA
jgi:hypothetical protein